MGNTTDTRYERLLQLSWQVLSYQLKVDGARTRCSQDIAKLREYKKQLKEFLVAEKQRIESKQQEIFQ